VKFKEDLRILKQYYGVFNNKELAKELGITESAVDGWNRRKSVPNKYQGIIKHYRETREPKNNINNNGIMVNGINNGKLQIHNHTYELDNKLCDLIKELSPKRKEYYFYKISAELLEDER